MFQKGDEAVGTPMHVICFVFLYIISKLIINIKPGVCVLNSFNFSVCVVSPLTECIISTRKKYKINKLNTSRTIRQINNTDLIMFYSLYLIGIYTHQHFKQSVKLRLLINWINDAFMVLNYILMPRGIDKRDSIYMYVPLYICLLKKQHFHIYWAYNYLNLSCMLI